MTIIRNGYDAMTMNRHGVIAFDFATVSGCDQLVEDTVAQLCLVDQLAQPMHVVVLLTSG